MAVNARTATHPIAPTTNIVSTIRTARTNMTKSRSVRRVDLVTVLIPVHHKVHKESVKGDSIFREAGLLAKSENQESAQEGAKVCTARGSKAY